jgi:glucose/arabinose dehydrogenase
MLRFRLAVLGVAAVVGTVLTSTVRAQAGGLPSDLRLVPVATGFQQPIAIEFPPDGSGRMFVIGRLGRVDVVMPGANTPVATPFLLFIRSGQTPPAGAVSPPHGPIRTEFENGLLGFAFHPQFATNGQFFVHYNDSANHTVIARYQVSSTDPNRFNASTAQVILRIEQESSIHKGGDLAFGPDGFLYIAMGDGSDQGDPCERAETVNVADLRSGGNCNADTNFVNSGGNPNSRALLGKMLRIDVDRTTPPGSNELCAALGDGSAPYAIPGSPQSAATIPNPYVGTAVRTGNCDEIWSYGWRNPWRFSFDRQSGDLFAGDVGWDSQEEVSLEPAGSTGGLSFGWDNCEGVRVNETPVGCMGSVVPIYTYPRSAGYGSSVTGGYVYRGAVDALQGLYLFGDYISGWLLFLRRPAPPATSWTLVPWFDSNFFVAALGEDASGELYVADYLGGRVLRVSSDQIGVVFGNGFE